MTNTNSNLPKKFKDPFLRTSPKLKQQNSLSVKSKQLRKTSETANHLSDSAGLTLGFEQDDLISFLNGTLDVAMQRALALAGFDGNSDLSDTSARS